METSFSNQQITILFLALILLLCSLVFHYQNKSKLSLFLLFGGAFMLRIFMIILDPFLSDWDERVHALVAKNMMEHPFKPMLFKELLLSYDYKNWINNHIWLHKQPLFLWQMALSLKIFGINEMAIRLPTVLLGAIQVLLIYRIGKISVHKEVGYLAAFLAALAYFQLEMTAGSIARAHNDASFVFYITASIWALCEYWQNKKKHWLCWIGVLAGMAVLNKWLVGLLIFAAWGIAVLASKEWREKRTTYQSLGMSIIISGLVFLPWQIYIFWRFPKEAAFEMASTSEHFFKVIEGHEKPWYYYFENLYVYYGEGSFLIIIAGIVSFLYVVQHRFLKIMLLSCLFIPYLFYSLAQTKLSGYTYIASPIVFICIATFIFVLQNFLQKKLNTFTWKTSMLILVSLMGFYSLRHWEIEAYHGLNKRVHHRSGQKRMVKLHNAKVYKELAQTLPKDYVILSSIPFESVDIRFYTSHLAYDYLTMDQHKCLTEAGYKIAAFEKCGQCTVPEYITDAPNTLLLEQSIKD